MTLAVVASVTYEREYYLLQASTLSPPAVPTANPPAAPWTTVEPNFTGGTTNTLYTVRLSVYGTSGYQYGPVQKSSAYEAAKQAYNLAVQAKSSADGKTTIFTSIAQPVATAQGDLWRQLDPTGASIIHIKAWNGSSWAQNDLYAESILASESITSPLIKAGSIEVDRVSPSFGTDLQLSANDSVRIIVGQQDELANQVGTVRDDLGVTNDTLTAVSGAASAAQSTATSALGAANQAGTTASAAKLATEAQRTIYDFTPTAAIIRTPGAEQSLEMSPTRISFKTSTQTLTYWEGGEMVVGQIKVESANISGHRWTRLSAGRSVLQPLS